MRGVQVGGWKIGAENEAVRTIAVGQAKIGVVVYPGFGYPELVPPVSVVSTDLSNGLWCRKAGAEVAVVVGSASWMRQLSLKR